MSMKIEIRDSGDVKARCSFAGFLFSIPYSLFPAVSP